ncbi:hypothetical protein DPPLL_12630 [Desulfofustis limnaeus]|uniref:Tetratricopeptide repeat protein n=1 Tax=Desulfofustis limnaeus TaxID=2740163 RepID=A0ABM7W7G5_9BACT|nr:hypothetical protein DPPLL_12630 [Desulfofustis limnaeus]
MWADALAKAPENARPYAKLSEIYGWKKEKNQTNFQTALSLLQIAIEKENPRLSFKTALIDNIGKLYMNYGLLEQAEKYFKESLEGNPNFLNSQIDLAQALTLQGKFTEALEQINIVISKNDKQSRFFNLQGLILLWLNRPHEAAEANQQAMQRTFVNKQRYFYNTGVALTSAGHFSQGRWFLGQALVNAPFDRRILSSLIENRLMAGDQPKARLYTLQLLSAHGIVSLTTFLEQARTEYAAVPINIDLISPLIQQIALETATNLKKDDSTNSSGST